MRAAWDAGMLWMPQDRPYSDQTIVDNVVGRQEGSSCWSGRSTAQKPRA